MTTELLYIPADKARRLSVVYAAIDRQAAIARCEEGLLPFIREFWHVLEPAIPLIEGWALEAMCEHLQAVSEGKINRLLINVPPGSMKSLLCNCFWPAWEWAVGLAYRRTLSFSYAAHLTERDTGRFRDLVTSLEYQHLFGDRYTITKAGELRVANDKRGWKIPSSVGGVSTGERADTVVLDDPHNVKQGESDIVRTSTVEWFGRSMSNRLNDMEKSAIVVIMQRVHENDVSGHILSNPGMGYDHLIIPAEWEERRRYRTKIGWTDPRTEDGELFWPERFSSRVIARTKVELGPYGFSGQMQQSPTPAGGGIIKSDWWGVWNRDAAEAEGVKVIEERTDGKTGKKIPEQVFFPAMNYIVAYVDTAYTEKEENDPSACTVWGIFTDRLGINRAMLMNAWSKRLEIEELVEEIAKTYRSFKVSQVLIEAKASGISVGQMLRKRNMAKGDKLALNPKMAAFGQFRVRLETPKGDKVSRAYAVQPLFAAGLIYAPLKGWAQMVIDQCSLFPKAAHDDLVDTTTGALTHLYRTGLLRLPDEVEVMDETERQHRPRLAPLYPV